MRISDWSSDVCSSDLEMLQPQNGVEQDEATGVEGKHRKDLGETVLAPSGIDAGCAVDSPPGPAEGGMEESPLAGEDARSEERRGGEEGVVSGRSRGTPQN